MAESPLTVPSAAAQWRILHADTKGAVLARSQNTAEDRVHLRTHSITPPAAAFAQLCAWHLRAQLQAHSAERRAALHRWARRALAGPIRAVKRCRTRHLSHLLAPRRHLFLALQLLARSASPLADRIGWPLPRCAAQRRAAVHRAAGPKHGQKNRTGNSIRGTFGSMAAVDCCAFRALQALGMGHGVDHAASPDASALCACRFLRPPPSGVFLVRLDVSAMIELRSLPPSICFAAATIPLRQAGVEPARRMQPGSSARWPWRLPAVLVRALPLLTLRVFRRPVGCTQTGMSRCRGPLSKASKVSGCH